MIIRNQLITHKVGLEADPGREVEARPSGKVPKSDQDRVRVPGLDREVDRSTRPVGMGVEGLVVIGTMVAGGSIQFRFRSGMVTPMATVGHYFPRLLVSRLGRS